MIEAYITNLGKYNEGHLRGEYLKFPATTEEVQTLLSRIGIDGVMYEEYFITDYKHNLQLAVNGSKSGIPSSILAIANKPTIITTKLPLDALRENLATIDCKTKTIDPSERIFSRITEMCAFYEVKRASWRIFKGAQNGDALLPELSLTAKP